MLDVFITVDTELWPSDPDFSEWPRRDQLDLAREMRRDIYGVTAEGEFGLRFQLDLLHRHGLKAVFLTEALFASVVGLAPLREIVALVQDAGQEVQLHLHTEWLRIAPNEILPGRLGANIRDFTLDEQVLLLSRGAENLKQCGVSSLRAYRAGNFGANEETLRALHRIGIEFDTSHSASYLGGACHLEGLGRLSASREVHGVIEVPVTWIEHQVVGPRHLQVRSSTFGEIKLALETAWKQGRRSLVIVSHSNELLTSGRDRPDTLAVARWRRLCVYLDQHRDRFRTATFGELDRAAYTQGKEFDPIRASWLQTAIRMGEQLAPR